MKIRVLAMAGAMVGGMIAFAPMANALPQICQYDDFEGPVPCRHTFEDGGGYSDPVYPPAPAPTYITYNGEKWVTYDPALPFYYDGETGTFTQNPF